ncbi:unnamed protein product [Aphanomyces euteiches]|uniref:L-type lectin-like domain-containing protein n=1 Tax=Aphanomyces euteiches TaxID=100861 RepID=A0A6G0WWT8_9STRA|nr:hypothetical protein Ae201684_010941 [Aphanomyces euteiches]KAH9061546.1 hypothetical protein Ae201684P_020881 [Aphanomyces euteiches]KAH9092232.1 hypothetical protein LEN26_018586 [Aphanomyces euteiches]KAH9157485.1 hypothetical protein AeRB84_000684 [Aphanomyces euteiches]
MERMPQLVLPKAERATMMKVLGAVALLATNIVFGEKLEQHSFGGPFKLIDSSGTRIINSTWSHGGSTEVLKSFIRLTPDRQSKRGYVWNNAPLERDTFSAVLQFRISGQGKKWFGDGIGLWLTNKRSHVQGENHGFTADFKGVGIILDTFVNHDHKGGHKDVTVQVNDGTKTLEVLQEETKIGCDAAFRYHEESAKFDPVFSSSRLRLVIVGNTLKLEVDEEATAVWKPCYEGTLPFSFDWLRDATVGITGSTGGLADNHDVLSFYGFSESDDIQMQLTDSEVYWNNYSKEHHDVLKSEHCDNSCKLIILEKALDNAKVDIEHQVVALKERTTKNIQKVKTREVEIHEKLLDLNARIENYMMNTVDSRIDSIANALQNEAHAELSNKVAVASGWKTPFALVSIGLLGGAFFLYRKYSELRKSHLF